MRNIKRKDSNSDCEIAALIDALHFGIFYV